MPFNWRSPSINTSPEYNEAAVKVVGATRSPQDEKRPIDEESIAHSAMSLNQLADEDSRIVYTYHLNAGSAHLQIMISIVPVDRHLDQYAITLSTKAGGVERTICEPVILKLFLGPRNLDFAAFIFPPKHSLPANCLYHLRVWLRAGQIDHRLFAENEFWIGKDPEFSAIGDASYAKLISTANFMLVYQGLVGRAQVNWIVRWHLISDDTYKITLEYEAGGVGRTLFDDIRVRLDCDPQSLAFVIYSIPVTSTPPNASHRLRFWISTPSLGESPTSSINSLHNRPYIFQRLWKSEDFKLGTGLNFEALGSKMVMGVADARGPQVEHHSRALPAPKKNGWSSENTEGGPSTHVSYYDDAGKTYL